MLAGTRARAADGSSYSLGGQSRTRSLARSRRCHHTSPPRTPKASANQTTSPPPGSHVLSGVVRSPLTPPTPSVSFFFGLFQTVGQGLKQSYEQLQTALFACFACNQIVCCLCTLGPSPLRSPPLRGRMVWSRVRSVCWNLSSPASHAVPVCAPCVPYVSPRAPRGARLHPPFHTSLRRTEADRGRDER